METQPDHRPRYHRVLVFAVVVAVAAGLGAAVSKGIRVVGESAKTPVLIVRAETDDKSRHASWLMLRQRMDHNYVLEIVDQTTNTTQTVFTSPDEGPPKNVRLRWSADNTALLIIGPEFSVIDQAKLPTGDKLYLLYDASTNTVRCNATQQNTFANFTADDVMAYQWRDDPLAVSPPAAP